MPKRNEDMQKKILDFIAAHMKETGYPPSVREIGQGVGLKSPSTVHGYLERMSKEGKLQKDSQKTRALRVTVKEPPAHEYLEVPVVGMVAAGQPILAQENVVDTYPLPMRFARKGELFMLQVKGDSMINAGILNGDYVIVVKQKVANNGEIVVARIDNEATVKRFYKEESTIRLQPENDAYDPIYSDSVEIEGKVVGLFRDQF